MMEPNEVTVVSGDVSDVFDAVLAEATERVVRDGETLPCFPHVTCDGHWLVSEHGRWTAGFFAGLQWLAHIVRRDEQTRTVAERWTRRLEFRATDRSTHDMGFLFEPSFIRGFHITGKPYFAQMAIRAAHSLVTRFRPDGAYIPAWDASEDPSYANLAIVDTIMNLPLLLWAAERENAADLAHVAEATAETILHQHIRADWTTIHAVDHDPGSGLALGPRTHQGAGPNTTWSRGQAWALHGFTRVAAITGSAAHLVAATRLAERYLNELGDDALPPWDFTRRASGEPRDSSAAAIAVSGILELAHLTGRADLAGAASQALFRLVCHAWNDDPGRSGLLLHGSVDVPRNSGVDESIIYGDHFFVEALVKTLMPHDWNLIGAVTWAPSN